MSCRSTARSCRSTRRWRHQGEASGRHHLAGDRAASTKTARRIAIARCSTSACRRFGICYGMQLMTNMPGGTPGTLRASRVRSCAGQGDTASRRACWKGMPDELKVHESRRLRRLRAAGLRRGRHEQQRAGRGDGSARARLLRAAVSSGSRAYRPRQGAVPQLRVRCLRLHR